MSNPTLFEIADDNVGETPEHEAFVIDTEEKAAWVADKILTYDERQRRLDEQHLRMSKALERDRARFLERFEPELRAWASANLKGKARFVDLLTGRLQFRKKPGGPRVVNKAAAIEWAKGARPDLVTTRTSVTDVLDVEALKGVVPTLPELPPGVEVVPEEDAFKVLPPKEGEG